jgi:outer membrane protein assembly factor BamB
MRNASVTKGVMVGCAMLLGTSGVGAQDWPQWRGSHRDAKAMGFKVPATWPKDLTQKWKVTVGTADATPALVGDKLYVFSREGGDEVIRCLDAGSGKEIWQDKYPTEPADGPARGHPGPRSSPAVVDGKVVTFGVRGMLSCFDAATGKKLWSKDEFPGYWPQFFTASSPIIVDGLCIAQLGGKENGRGAESGAIVAYDLATGNEKWKWTSGSPAYASPELMKVNGDHLLVAETEGKVVALNARNGKLAWEVPFAAQRMQYNAATPIVYGQTIIYGGGGRGAKAVKLEKEGDRFVAKELWTNKETSVQFNTPVLRDGLLFGLSQRNEFFCMNAENGKTQWTAPVGPATAGGGAGGGGGGGRGRGGRMGGGGAGYGSIVDAGSVLVALTPSSQLIFFQPSDKAFTELARYKIADTPTYAYPVVAGNRMFIKDQSSVILWTIP